MSASLDMAFYTNYFTVTSTSTTETPYYVTTQYVTKEMFEKKYGKNPCKEVEVRDRLVDKDVI